MHGTRLEDPSKGLHALNSSEPLYPVTLLYTYLHHVLPPRRMVDNLRVRGHVYNLPECSTSAHKKSFVVRSLYNFI